MSDFPQAIDHNGMRNQAIQAANRELTARSFALTAQILAVHEVAESDGNLVVHSVSHTDNGHWQVYFALQHEPYFLEVTLTQRNAEFSVAGVAIVPKVLVHLVIRSDILTIDEITARIGLAPTHPRRDQVWDFRPEPGGPGDVDAKLTAILARLALFAPGIAQLARARDAHVRFAVCYEAFKEWMGGCELSPHTMAKLAEFGATLWFDLYASGPDIPE